MLPLTNTGATGKTPLRRTRRAASSPTEAYLSSVFGGSCGAASHSLASLVMSARTLWSVTCATAATGTSDSLARQHHRLRSALSELCPHPEGQLPTARKVGYALRRFRGRVVGGCRLQTRVLEGNNVWFVERVGGRAVSW